MVILSERAAKLYKGHEADKTGLGLVVRINFAILHSPGAPPWKFQVIAAYLPPKPGSNPGANTMWSKLQSFLAASLTTRETNPRKYLESKVTNWVHKSLARHELTLLMGDLNGVLDPGVRSRNITEFVKSNGMHAPFTDVLLPEREFHTFYRQDEGISRVDHILHSNLPDGVSLACLGVHSPPQYEPAFDHRPLFLGIHFAAGFKAVPTAPDTVRAPRTDLRKTDWQSVADFVSMTDAAAGPLEDAISADPLRVANNLSVFVRSVVKTTAVLTDQSTITRLRGKHVNVYQKGMKRRGNPFKDGYSPHMRVIQTAMHLYLEVRQRVACKRSTQAVDSPEFLSWLREAVDHWEEGLRDLTKEDGSPFETELLGMQITPANGAAPRDISPLTLPAATPSTFSRGCLDESIHKLRSLLHGRARARLRDLVSSKVRALQEAYTSKRFAYIIRKLGYKEPVPLDPHSLVLPDGEITTNPVRINENITDHFRAHHMRPSGLDSTAKWVHKLGPADINSLLAGVSTDTLDPAAADSNIPRDLLNLVLEHCRTKVSEEVSREIAGVSAKPIRFDEFNDAIDRAKSDKAPGPSGFTINMLKSLSTDSKRFIHRSMTVMWEKKFIPQWMKDRMMALIPKKSGEPTLDNLRPIGLLEVLRKIWAGIVIRRIQRVWEKHGCLHPSQHGYRWGNGTDHATARAIDKVEQAKESGDPLLATLWDIKAAFDSVPRPFMNLAWRRLGVPDDVAEWITSLDEGGLTLPATPHVLLNQQLRDAADMNAEDGSFLRWKHLGFLSERGIIQGGTESALSWIALYDILLCIVNGPDAADLRGALLAYADDLMSVSNSKSIQQKIADRLSAFCCFAGMEIATNKVEYVSINCPRKPAPLQIHDLEWTAHPVPCVPGKENVRYLGISLPVGGDDLPTLRWARDLLMTSLKHLELRAAPISCKIYVATAQIFPAVMYRATKASWTLSQYRSLDKIFSSFYRRIFRLERSFPEALLYASTRFAALGLRRFSDEAQKLKWHSIQRLLEAADDTKRAAEAIIERAFHAHSLPTASAGPALLTSLLQWGSANGLSLSKRKPHRGADAALVRISEALHPGVPSRVESVFTDGSVKLEGLEVSDSLARKESLGAKASGAFSVVVVFVADHDGRKHSKAIRIPVSTDKVTAVTPYLMELLGQLVVASVCDLSHPDTKVYCDCSSVVTNVNNTVTSGIKSLSASSHKFLLGSLPPGGHTVEWTRSHPERRLSLEDVALWSDKDKGIYAADAAAGAEFAELNRPGLPVCIFSELVLPELVDALIPEGTWHWREDRSSGRILTTSIDNHCQRVLLDNYCAARDKYRAKRNQAPKWDSVLPVLAKSTLTYWARKKQCLRAWDKSFTNGYNRAKSNHADPKCSQCGQEDSVFHMCPPGVPRPTRVGVRRSSVCVKAYLERCSAVEALHVQLLDGSLLGAGSTDPRRH